MSKTGTDLVKHLGELAFATRLKRLADNLQADVGRVYREMEVEFEPKWFTMLYALYHNQTMSVVELSTLLRLTHPAIIQFAEQMQERKLLTQIRDKNDARKKMITLTEKGRKTFEKIEPVLHEIELANRDFLRESGTDLLGTIERMERLLDEKSMYRRVNERLNEVFRKDVRIVNYQPRLKQYFKTLNEEWLKKYFSVEPIDERVLNNPTKEVLNHGGEIFFAEYKDEVIGTVAVRKEGEHGYELMKMAVAEPYQSKGVGRLLLEKAIGFAREQKATFLELDTSRKLEKALKLYEDVGFKISDELPSHNYERCTIKMRLDLNSILSAILVTGGAGIMMWWTLKFVLINSATYSTIPLKHFIPGGFWINGLLDLVMKLVS